MKTKTIAMILIALFALFLFSGCKRSDNLNSLAFVNVITITKTEEGELKADFYISTMAPKASAENAENGYYVFSAQGKNFEACMLNCEKQANQKLFLGQLKTIIFSEKLLKDGERMESLLFYFCRNKNFNLSTSIYGITKEDELKKKIEEKDVMAIELLEKLSARGSFIDSSILTFFETVRNKGSFSVPTIETKPVYSLNSVCVMEDYKLYAKYTGEAIVPYAMLCNKLDGYYFTTPSAELLMLSANARMQLKGNQLCIKINMDVEIVNVPKPLEISSTEDSLVIKQQAQQVTKKLLDEYIEKSSKELDIYKLLDIEQYMEKYHPRFSGELKDLEVTSKVEAKIVRSGTMR